MDSRVADLYGNTRGDQKIRGLTHFWLSQEVQTFRYCSLDDYRYVCTKLSHEITYCLCLEFFFKIVFIHAIFYVLGSTAHDTKYFE